MRIGNFNFQDDRTVTPYEERYIEDEVCTVDIADMTMREIKVHDIEFTVSRLSPTAGSTSTTKSFATDYGIELSSEFDYKLFITLSTVGANPLPTTIDLKINPHGTSWHPTTLSPASLTFNDKFSSLNAAYNMSVRIDTSSSTTQAVKVKIEVVQIVPESRRYLNCVGQYETVSIPYVSFPVQIETSSTFSGALNTQYYNIRKYSTTGILDVPACQSHEIYNEAVIISNHAVAQNYWLLNQQIPINVKLLNGYPVGMEFMDEVNITDIATSLVTNFTEFQTPVSPSATPPLVYTEYDINSLGFHEIAIRFDGNPSTVTRVQLSLRYDYQLSTCECECLVCRDGNLLDITWTNDCDDTFNTSIEGSLQAGSYKMEGESFQNSRGDEIYPVVSTQSEYTLAIHRYSDAVFQGLTHLIASNKVVEINGAEYRVKLDGITPKWNEWHTYGNIELTLVKVDSIRTYKKGCNC